MARNQLIGGRRPGAGRKKGGKNKATVQKEMLRKRLEELVAQEYDPIVLSKISLAKGFKVMMQRDWVKGKDGKMGRKGQWKQVTDPKEVERLLNSECEGEDYYQIWTENPESRAGEYLIDQVIGKPRESVEFTGSANRLHIDVVVRKALSEGYGEKAVKKALELNDGKDQTE